jgi:hypothetical protein
MSQTKRFLESIEAEQDYLGELHAKIETTVAALCDGDSEKLENVMDVIRMLENQSNCLSRNVWLDLEPKIKNENSELLSLVNNLVSTILLSECDKWLMKK